MIDIVSEIFVYYSLFALFYLLAINLFSFILYLFAARELFYYKRKRQVYVWHEKNNLFVPRIAILVPAYNEELTIIDSVNALFKLNYPKLEIIVINDGSKDDTLKQLYNHFKLFQVTRAVGDEIIVTKAIKNIYKSAGDDRLLVIDKENGGKADSLNAGLNYSRSRLFCSIDADSLLEKDALSKIIQAYLERDTKVIALGGIIRIANDCKIKDGVVETVRLPKHFLPAMQVMEYIRAFLIGRAGWNKMNGLLILSGAFGVFEWKAVMQIGGYNTDTVSEDMELTLRLHRWMREKKRPYKILFLPDPVCWTQAPDSLKMLARQRNRWQRGLVETMITHWKMIGNPKYGLTGLIAMPYFLFFEILAPVIELTGYVITIIAYILGWIKIEFVILFLLVAIFLSVLLSLFSLLLEEMTVKRYNNPRDIIRLFILSVLENFGYRQLNSWWRLRGIFDLIVKKKKSWGFIKRKSFTKKDP